MKGKIRGVLKLMSLMYLTYGVASCSNPACTEISNVVYSESFGHLIVEADIFGGRLIQQGNPGSLMGQFVLSEINDSLFDQECFLSVFSADFKVVEQAPDILVALKKSEDRKLVQHPQYISAQEVPYPYMDKAAFDNRENVIAFKRVGQSIVGVYYLGSLQTGDALIYETDSYKIYRTRNGFYKLRDGKAKWLYQSNRGEQSVYEDTYLRVGLFQEPKRMLFFSRKLDKVNLTYTMIDMETDSIFELEEYFGNYLSDMIE